MFDWLLKRHKHSWKALRTAYYYSITGPRTVISWKCTTCPAIQDDNRNGYWKVEDFS